MRLLVFYTALVISCCVEAAALADDDSDKLARAGAALKRADNQEALKAADEAVKADPKSAEAHYLRGEAYSRFRKHKEAIDDFSKAYELDKTFGVAINQRGGERFKMGDINGSLEDFEAYIKLEPKAYDDHWRYGISLYYARRFAEGAKQFKAGEKAFGNDVENAFFHYLCIARLDGVEKARQGILKIGPDSRVPMMKIYDLIQGKAKPDDVIETVEKAKLKAEGKHEALFYAYLYIALNYEAEGDDKRCREYLKLAEKQPISHYMWDVAHVHLLLLDKK